MGVGFLRIDGIAGEAVLRGRERWIEVASFDWSVDHLRATAGSGAGAGRTVPQPLTVQCVPSVASPRLFLAVARGTAIRKAEFELVRPGDVSFVYLALALQDVRVVSYQLGNEPEEDLLETFSLSYSRLSYTVTPQRPNGTAGTEVTGGWDFARNQPL